MTYAMVTMVVLKVRCINWKRIKTQFSYRIYPYQRSCYLSRLVLRNHGYLNEIMTYITLF